MVITPNIKDIMLIAYAIHTVKRRLYILKVSPFSASDCPNPILQSCFGIGEPFYIAL